MKVPFLDLKAQYLSIKDEIHVAIQQVLDATAFAGGPFVSQFEKEFGAFCGCDHAIGVGSGTEALWLLVSGRETRSSLSPIPSLPRRKPSASPVPPRPLWM